MGLFFVLVQFFWEVFAFALFAMKTISLCFMALCVGSCSAAGIQCYSAVGQNPGTCTTLVNSQKAFKVDY